MVTTDMKNEKLFVYYYAAQANEADLLLSQLKEYGLNVESIDLDKQDSEIELVNGLVEHSENPFPILRIGEQKIKAMLQNPNSETIRKLFSDNTNKSVEIPKATIYSTSFCGDCRQLKMWMDSQKISYKEILIEDSEELKEQITRWSGGRRVVPTVEYKSVGRLFNPGIKVFQKLYETS